MLDEKEGRRKADKHGLKTTGVIGILLKANSKKNLDMQEELDSLREAGFWISDGLYQKILSQSE